MVSTVLISGDKLLLGTHQGWIYICNIDNGQIIYTVRAKESPVTRLTADLQERYVGACCQDGSVFILASAGQDTSDSVTWELLELPMEDQGSAVDIHRGRRGEVTMLIGTCAGTLLQWSSTSWYGMKEKEAMLYSGGLSPVESIATRGHLGAWADSNRVRVMNLETRRPLCYLSQMAPQALTPAQHTQAMHAQRCTLVWGSSKDLLVGWGRNFKHLVVDSDDGDSPSSPGSASSKIRADRLVEGEIRGLAPVGSDHVVLIVQGNRNGVSSSRSASPTLFSPPPPHYSPFSEGSESGGSADVHLMLVHRRKGTVHLVEKVESLSVGLARTCIDATYSALEPGGFRAVLALNGDLVVAASSNVDDCVSAALRVSDYRRAADLALSGGSRNLLRRFTQWDIVSLYLLTLLDRGEGALAASETVRLLRGDEMAWANWVMIFIERDHMVHLAPLLPAGEGVRLDGAIYELVLRHLLSTGRELEFRSSLRRWLAVADDAVRDSAVSVEVAEDVGARLFDYEAVCGHLQEASVSSTVAPITVAVYSECRATLLLAMGRWQDAVSVYLDAAAAFRKVAWHTPVDPTAGPPPSERMDLEYTDDVLALVEEQSLHSLVVERILDMASMSPRVVTDYLPKQLDHFPIGTVARQLRADSFLLHLYLHTLFTTRRDVYNAPECASYHMLQVPLYVQYVRKSRNKAALSRTERRQSTPSNSITANDADQRSFGGVLLPDLVFFLQKSSHAPMELALEECKFHIPPLYTEIAYIYAATARCRAAVEVLLTKCQDVAEAVRFVDLFGPPDLLGYVAERCVAQGAEAVSALLDCLARRNVMETLPQVMRNVPASLQIDRLGPRLAAIVHAWQRNEAHEAMVHGLHVRDVEALRRRRARGSEGRAGIVVRGPLCCEYCRESATSRAPFAKGEGNAVMVFPGQRAYHLRCHRRALAERSVSENFVTLAGSPVRAGEPLPPPPLPPPPPPEMGVPKLEEQ